LSQALDGRTRDELASANRDRRYLWCAAMALVNRSGVIPISFAALGMLKNNERVSRESGIIGQF
jgi:hypothetical protein